MISPSHLLVRFFITLLLLCAGASSGHAQQPAKLDGAGGGFVEIVGNSDALERISYGMNFTVKHNKFTGTASSNELHPDGSVGSHSLTITGRITGCSVSKLTQYGDGLYYKKVKGLIVFTLSDGTTFSGTLKGTVDTIGGGYSTKWTGQFTRGGYQNVSYNFSEQMHVKSGNYSW